MGMFDTVNYKDECHNCGAELEDFQSKDHYCLLNHVEPSQVDNFYVMCEECKTWHDYQVHRECIVKGIVCTTSRQGVKDGN
jgi:methionyl-tRNA synthetase